VCVCVCVCVCVYLAQIDRHTHTHTHTHTQDPDKFLLSGRRRKKNKQSTYLISTDEKVFMQNVFSLCGVLSIEEQAVHIPHFFTDEKVSAKA
jgi:hypothetical protein